MIFFSIFISFEYMYYLIQFVYSGSLFDFEYCVFIDF